MSLQVIVVLSNELGCNLSKSRRTSMRRRRRLKKRLKQKYNLRLRRWSHEEILDVQLLGWLLTIEIGIHALIECSVHPPLWLQFLISWFSFTTCFSITYFPIQFELESSSYSYKDMYVICYAPFPNVAWLGKESGALNMLLKKSLIFQGESYIESIGTITRIS